MHLALANVRTPNGYEKWASISAEPTGLHTFDEYGLCFDIEENFLNDKSADFQLKSSQLRNAEALQRLCLILAAATLYLVSTSTAMTAMGRRRLVDPHWKRVLIYFQIGWGWVRHALNSGAKLLSFAWFEYGPDPFPAVSSYFQVSLNYLVFDTLAACRSYRFWMKIFPI